jgi:NADPH:quinone reductase-like Zn-dependent oxidoreductase
MSPQPTMMRAVGRSCPSSGCSGSSSSGLNAHIDVAKLEVKDGKGPAESLFISNQIPRPAPQSGQALVKIRAFGLNRMDILQRNGNYPVPPQAGKILGVEFSGVVESLAESDGEASYGGFKAGDEVFGLAYGGAYAEYIAITTKMLLHKPKTMSFEEAAAIPEVSFFLVRILTTPRFGPIRRVWCWHKCKGSMRNAAVKSSASWAVQQRSTGSTAD